MTRALPLPQASTATSRLQALINAAIKTSDSAVALLQHGGSDTSGSAAGAATSVAEATRATSQLGAVLRLLEQAWGSVGASPAVNWCVRVVAQLKRLDRRAIVLGRAVRSVLEAQRRARREHAAAKRAQSSADGDGDGDGGAGGSATSKASESEISQLSVEVPGLRALYSSWQLVHRCAKPCIMTGGGGGAVAKTD